MNDLSEIPSPITLPEQVVSHLSPEFWAKANRLLIRKAIAEYSHELLLEPRLEKMDGNWGHYVLENNTANLEYRFRARRLALDHWQVDAASLEKKIDGRSAVLDALNFIIEFREELKLSNEVMPVYLEEVSSTLFGIAYKMDNNPASAAELAVSDYQAVEVGMTEGHPTFIANNGRLGFDTVDYPRYAPEAGSPINVIWLAVHKDEATFSSISTLDYDQLIAAELGQELIGRFNTTLQETGVDPNDYLFMPAHPWQWFNKLSIAFAADVANRHIVCLGTGPDNYLAQQSIRTFFNISDPNKHYVKTALSILNMGFMRGLSPAYMLVTPAINEWLKNLLDNDPYLVTKGFSIVREVAAIGYRNPHYETAVGKESQYKKMLAALWRESPIPQLGERERLMTMASLVHVDYDGDALVSALIEASGLDPADWVKRYLNAYFAPLVHCFYNFDLAFMPHGENLILVLDEHVPVRVIMKDIGEEIGILNGDIELPDEISRISFTINDEMKLNCIFTDVFDCFFRYLAATLDEHAGLSEDRFWQLVGECVREYQAAHPQHAEKYSRYDMFAETFPLNCLNRLQMNNNKQMLDLLNPEESLVFAGSLKNPLASLC